MGKMKEILKNATTPFTTVDNALNDAWDKRERFEDDELDNLSMRIVYEDTLKAHGWTRSDFEYVSNRTPDGDEEVDNGSDCIEQDEVEDSDYYADDALDHPEEGGAEVGDYHG